MTNENKALQIKVNDGPNENQALQIWIAAFKTNTPYIKDISSILFIFFHTFGEKYSPLCLLSIRSNKRNNF